MHTICDASGLVSIPDDCDSASAAALMCGGATAWTVLTRYNIQARQRVGIVGVGGMGHLAVKLSAALGYHTVVFSRSMSKRDDCIRFGAKEFHVLPSNTQARDRPPKSGSNDSCEDYRPVDHLLLCSSASEDFGILMGLVATHGTIYPLTVSLEPVPVPLLAMIDNGIRIQGSLTAPSESISELLEFCAVKNIFPTVQTHPMNPIGVENAFRALKQGKLRYKAVLKRDTIT